MAVPAAVQRKSGQLDSPRRIDRDEASGGFLESDPGLLILPTLMSSDLISHSLSLYVDLQGRLRFEALVKASVKHTEATVGPFRGLGFRGLGLRVSRVSRVSRV